MATKNPLGKIKDVAVGTLKAPVQVAGAAAGSAVGLARTATGAAAGAVGSLVGKGSGAEDEAADGPVAVHLEESLGEGVEAEQTDRAEQDGQDGQAEPDGQAEQDEQAADEPDDEPIDEVPPAVVEKLEKDPEEPVNVTEELGLDPAPVDKPKRRKKKPAAPTNPIDAQADPSDVDVTPADVAEVVSKEPGEA